MVEGKKYTRARSARILLTRTVLIALIVVFACAAAALASVSRRKSADWPLLFHDVGHTNYQPYGRIDLNRLSVLWVYNFSDLAATFLPIAYDLNGDRSLEVVVVRNEPAPDGDRLMKLYCFDSRGVPLWTFCPQKEGRLSSPIDLDVVGVKRFRGVPTFLAVHGYCTYLFLNSSGKIHASFSIKELGLRPERYRVHTLLPCGTDASGHLRMIGFAEASPFEKRHHYYVFCLTYPELKVYWKCYVNKYLPEWFDTIFMPTLADVDGDGMYEIITVSLGLESVEQETNRILCIDHDGSVLWNKTLPCQGSWFWSHVIRCCGEDADPYLVRFALLNHAKPRVCTFDARGNFLWSVNFSHEITEAAAADFDQDGVYELVLGGGGQISLLDDSGLVRWQFSLPQSYRIYSLVLADCDMDPRPEILTIVSKATFCPDVKGYFKINNTLCCIDDDGNLLWTYTLPNIDEMATGLITADLNGDGLLEILVLTYLRLYCLSAPLCTSFAAFTLSPSLLSMFFCLTPMVVPHQHTNRQ